LVFVNTNPSRQQTSIPAMPQSSTTTRTPTPTTTRSSTTPILPIPLPTLTLPTGPTTSTSGETEPVAYDVTGQGRAINITYVDEGGVMQTEFNVLLPWHKEVNLAKPAKESASVTVINAGRDVTCKISIGGAQVQERTGAVLTVCSPSG
jgi:Mycobacterium membrane protein